MDKRKMFNNVSEIEVYYKRKVKLQDMPIITSSSNAEDYLRYYWGRNKMDHSEKFMVLYLNRSNAIMGWSRISTGGLSGTAVDPKIIFQIALKANSSSIILAHNHPSGNKQPSEQDIKLTRKIVKGGLFLELPVLDHLILTSESYFSFADEGILLP